MIPWRNICCACNWELESRCWYVELGMMLHFQNWRHFGDIWFEYRTQQPPVDLINNDIITALTLKGKIQDQGTIVDMTNLLKDQAGLKGFWGKFNIARIRIPWLTLKRREYYITFGPPTFAGRDIFFWNMTLLAWQGHIFDTNRIYCWFPRILKRKWFFVAGLATELWNGSVSSSYTFDVLCSQITRSLEYPAKGFNSVFVFLLFYIKSTNLCHLAHANQLKIPKVITLFTM